MQSLKFDCVALPIEKRCINIAVVACVANCIFTIDFKRTGTIDSFTVDFEPGTNVFAKLCYLRIKIATTILGDVE